MRKQDVSTTPANILYLTEISQDFCENLLTEAQCKTEVDHQVKVGE